MQASAGHQAARGGAPGPAVPATSGSAERSVVAGDAPWVTVGSAPDWLRRATALALAVLSSVGVWVLWELFVNTSRGQAVDELARRGATYGQGHLWRLAEPVLDVVSTSFVALGIAVAMAVALLRRRWWLALQVAVLVGGANLTTQVLKASFFTRPHLVEGWTGANTLPSGHTTVAASVSVALLLVVPRGARPLVALLGAAYTAATGVSTLVGQWHRPSDVVAGLLVVSAWTGLVCAFTSRSSLDVPRLDRGGAARRSPGSYVAAIVLVGAAGLTGAVALGAVHDVDAAVRAMAGALWSVRRSTEVTAYIGGAFGVLAATSLVFALILAVRQLTATTSRPVPAASAVPTPVRHAAA